MKVDVQRLREDLRDAMAARDAMKAELNDFTARAFEIAAGKFFWQLGESNLPELLAIAEAYNAAPVVSVEVTGGWVEAQEPCDGAAELDGQTVRLVRVVGEAK